MKSQSVSLSCCMNSWTSEVLSHWALKPASLTTLETMSLVVWFWNVRTLRARMRMWDRSKPRTISSTPPAPKLSSSETISPLNRLVVVSWSRAPSLTSSDLPMSKGLESIGWSSPSLPFW